MTIETIKFSQMTDGGDLANNEHTPGLLGGANVLFNNPWTFLPSGTTAERPAPSSLINYRLRFNTEEEQYEYYDAGLGVWTQLQENAFTVGPFITYTADTGLPDAQNLGFLSDGILKQTISSLSATLDIAVNGVDYYGPGFTGYLQSPAGTKDVNGNIVMQWIGVTDAVNHMRFTNSIIGVGPTLETRGADTDVDMNFVTQGSGKFTWSTFNNSAFTFETGALHHHVTNFIFPDTAQSWDATWQDSSGTVAWLSDVMGVVTSAEGTENQVLVNGNFGTQETGACIFTTPQDIATSSTPQFAGAYFGSATGPQATTAGTIQVIGLSGANASATLASYFSGGSGSAPTFWTYKSRSATVSAFAAVHAGDSLGRWEAFADDGTQFSRAGDIVITAAGTISSGVMPGVWTFRTTNASGVITFAMSIDETQLVTTEALFSNTSIQANTALLAGEAAGGTIGTLTLYPVTTALGSNSFTATNNAGNYANILTNAATSAARTWTLPDATGTLALTSGASGIVNSGTAGQLTYYAGTGTTVSGTNAGTGVLTALGVNVGTAGAFVVNGGALGTPSSGTLTSCTGLPIGGITGLGTGVATALAANVTGSGGIVLANAPTFVTGTVTAPSVTFSSTSGIIGTTTNDNAAAGSVGEFVSSIVLIGSAVSLTNAASANVTSISLTAGDWDVWGNVGFNGGATTLVTDCEGWISTVSATIPDGALYNGNSYGVAGLAIFAANNIGLQVPARRISVSGTTTVYLSARAGFSMSTCTAFGGIYARRRR